MIEPLCNARRCIIVGSAPGVKLPGGEPGDVILGANGGAAIARDSGRRVDVLCTTTFLFRRGCTRQEFATLESLRDLGVQSLWLDEQVGPGASMEEKLKVLGVRYQRLRAVPLGERREIVSEATGSELRVSTGVFAACLAAVSGAREIILCGVDPEAVGHEGMPWDEQPRDHSKEDTEALRALCERAVNVFRKEIEVTEEGDSIARYEMGPLQMEMSQ